MRFILSQMMLTLTIPKPNLKAKILKLWSKAEVLGHIKKLKFSIGSALFCKYSLKEVFIIILLSHFKIVQITNLTQLFKLFENSTNKIRIDFFLKLKYFLW
jgi:hypothetical protein